MIHMLQSIKQFFSKKRNIFFLVLLIAGGVYAYLQFSKPAMQVKYVLGTADKGLFIGSISGTGQVSGENQIDLKPKVSGAVLSIAIKEGQAVKKGDMIMQLDTTDAQKTIRDASQAVHCRRPRTRARSFRLKTAWIRRKELSRHSNRVRTNMTCNRHRRR